MRRVLPTMSFAIGRVASRRLGGECRRLACLFCWANTCRPTRRARYFTFAGSRVCARHRPFLLWLRRSTATSLATNWLGGARLAPPLACVLRRSARVACSADCTCDKPLRCLFCFVVVVAVAPAGFAVARASVATRNSFDLQRRRERWQCD